MSQVDGTDATLPARRRFVCRSHGQPGSGEADCGLSRVLRLPTEVRRTDRGFHHSSREVAHRPQLLHRLPCTGWNPAGYPNRVRTIDRAAWQMLTADVERSRHDQPTNPGTGPRPTVTDRRGIGREEPVSNDARQTCRACGSFGRETSRRPSQRWQALTQGARIANAPERCRGSPPPGQRHTAPTPVRAPGCPRPSGQ